VPIGAQARTGGPAFFVCTSERGTGAADLYVAKKRGKTAKKRTKNCGVELIRVDLSGLARILAICNVFRMPEAGAKTMRPRVPTWNNSPATRTSTFDPGLGWRRVPVEDEAFPKMHRGWPDEWARGWNWTPA
jgi:hypothetical protein